MLLGFASKEGTRYRKTGTEICLCTIFHAKGVAMKATKAKTKTQLEKRSRLDKKLAWTRFALESFSDAWSGMEIFVGNSLSGHTHIYTDKKGAHDLDQCAIAKA